MLFKRKWNVIWIALVLVALVAFSSGCKKKAPPPPPPPPAPAPAPPPPPPPAPKASLGERLGQLQDAYFDYDKSDIREDARAALTKDADALKAIFQEFPSATLSLEGHCDERGSRSEE